MLCTQGAGLPFALPALFVSKSSRLGATCKGTLHRHSAHLQDQALSVGPGLQLNDERLLAISPPALPYLRFTPPFRFGM